MFYSYFQCVCAMKWSSTPKVFSFCLCPSLKVHELAIAGPRGVELNCMYCRYGDLMI